MKNEGKWNKKPKKITKRKRQGKERKRGIKAEKEKGGGIKENVRD